MATLGLIWHTIDQYLKVAKLKKLTINGKAGRYFAVFSVEVPESAWQIVPMQAGWHAGIDPGAQTALTVALKNSNSGDLRHLAIHYEFLEKAFLNLKKFSGPFL